MAKKYKIMLDPGHGGGDPGAVGPTGLREKDVTLSLSKRLGERLTELGFDVSYTRTSDKRIIEDSRKDLEARCDRANSLKVDYYISLHCNSLNATANGIETLVYSKGGEAEALANKVQNQLIQNLELTNRGVKSGNLAVLRGTDMPAILVEIGFISNPKEEQLLKDSKFLDKAVEAMAKGLCEYTEVAYQSGAPLVPPAGSKPTNSNTPSDWAEEAWNWAVNQKITDGSRPKDKITREEVIAFLHKFDKLK